MQSIKLEYIEQIAIQGLIDGMLKAAPSPKNMSAEDYFIYQALQTSLVKFNNAIKEEEKVNA
jgi:hypothetical protein